MKFKEYLLSKTVTLCFLLIGVLAFASLAVIANIAVQAVLLLTTSYLLIILSWLIVSFFIERKRSDKIAKIIDELPQKYLLAEVIPVPFTPLEKRYFQMLKEISHSAISVAEQAMREKAEYCDYVESWIHEIKTPLTACSLILANGGDAKKLKAELKRADNLTESILYYARMGTAQKDIQIKKICVSEVINNAVMSQMELLIASKIRVETQGDFEVYSDDKIIDFVLKQLLINSAKYCPGCLVQITAKDGVVTVEDNGIGIPSFEVRRVTERCFTGTNGRKLGNSTGMGLYIVKELCQHLDIDMKIESVQGEYTKTILSFRNLTKM